MSSEPPADTLFLSPGARISIREHLAAAYPLEGCGFLVGCGCSIDRAIPARNAEAHDSAQRFTADPRDLLAVEKELSRSRSPEQVLGFFHSHPDALARPSSFDLECAQGLYEVARFQYFYIIVEVTAGGSGHLSAWRLNQRHDAFAELRCVTCV